MEVLAVSRRSTPARIDAAHREATRQRLLSTGLLPCWRLAVYPGGAHLMSVSLDLVGPAVGTGSGRTPLSECL
jgi:hypothetical protein